LGHRYGFISSQVIKKSFFIAPGTHLKLINPQFSCTMKKRKKLFCHTVLRHSPWHHTKNRQSPQSPFC
jgi:hypothetical protein